METVSVHPQINIILIRCVPGLMRMKTLTRWCKNPVFVFFCKGSAGVSGYLDGPRAKLLDTSLNT